MNKETDVDTLQRITTLEVKQENTDDKIDSLLRSIEKSIDALSKEVHTTKKELEIVYREGMLDLRADLNENVSKTNKRFEAIEERVAVNEKHRERLAVYLSFGAIVLGIFLTYLKDIISWLFNR